MMSDNLSPSTDKWLHADGSVSTAEGEVILPADQNRAQDYASRMAHADKWMHPDGSVTDSKGAEILPADESRAQDYESRMPGVGGILLGTGIADPGLNEEFVPEEVPNFLDGGFVYLQPFIRETEDTILTYPAVYSQDASLIFFPWIETAEFVTEQYNFSDTATAVLSEESL